MTKKLINGFATKKDINHLENKMNQKFALVDKRFEQVDKRFTWFRGEIKDDLEIWMKDNYRKFENCWQQKIDPILKEIEKHRENEVIMAEQYRRLETLMIKIADKVGVEVTD